ncbi:MAG: hypothetical protein RLZZ241_84 [Bacteroidota bacterium]|jgi:hypothetical protein
MAERLVIISDMIGTRQGLWIASYLGYLQQYFDIVYYDSQELAGVDLMVKTRENLCEALMEGGYSTGVSSLIAKEKRPSHYLAFCAGGTIAWKAALQGLPIKSLYAISPLWLQEETNRPQCSVHLIYGETHKERPSAQWAKHLEVPIQVIENFGRDLYSDEKIIKKVCAQLLQDTLQNTPGVFKKQLSVY